MTYWVFPFRVFFRLDSDLLDFLPYVTLQTSKWHSGGTKRQFLDMCLQRGLWSDAEHESVLWNHPDWFPAITALRFTPSTKIKIEQFQRHCNQFWISSLSSKNTVWILLIIILKQSTELKSIKSLCQQICSACLAMIATRGMSCFFMENFIKTSFSWPKLCFHAPVYVYCVPSS